MDTATDRRAAGAAFLEDVNPKAAAALRKTLSDVAPDLMDYALEFAFGEIYSRGGIAKRDRQIATLAALAARGDAGPQLRIHIGVARSLGMSKDEIAEIFIQLAPYAGFPAAINAVTALEDVY